MVKIVVKKEGATQTCGKCGTDLICRLKDYGGNFAPTLQWQNYNGEAHFKTLDGKKYNCNIPDDDETAQTRIPTTTAATTTTPGDIPQNKPLPYLDIHSVETIQNIDIRLQRVDEMIQAIFRYTIDEQLKKK